ncbi:PepSY domain-containing protein [Bosea sp. BK604]|uniref:PepSY domain-containing protein n=1 Tax=Bosea sp. BK604 TaxID=2512180 RepID=UPI00104E3350|nr:PepSY domain-containing protein [Bosea sp. BK604]TCR61825.1 YpeB-like protein with putative protease inhibitory function [Bosea sp. BK604]
MMIGSIASLSFIVLASVAPTTPSTAGEPTQIAKPSHIRIDERQARRIAWDYGIVRIEEIALAGGRWEIAGRDDEDGELALDIDAHSGKVSR